ncbi:MAG: WG repeat-containing protein [Bacteroidales bacterium]|nr:WG repeat-containing protein [Bacteroidales bacterium]
MPDNQIIGLRSDGYISFMDGLYEGLRDVGGQVIISPGRHFRSIGEFVDGVAIVYYYDHEPQLGAWGLIDQQGNAITEFRYWFIEPFAKGLYRVSVTPGLRKNLMRTDGTFVFDKDFQNIYGYRHGYVIASNTIRRTKSTPTRYPKGLLHCSGATVLPVEYSRMEWLEEYSFTPDENTLGEGYDVLYIEREGYVGMVKTSWLSVQVDEFTVDAPFLWKGVMGTICDGCIYANGIPAGGRGCGRLFAHSFRERYVKGHCEFRKEKLSEPSVFERERIEYWKNRLHIEAPLQEPRRLVSDFIAEHLGGDISRLANYDFRQLKDMPRYGDTHGFAFTPLRTDLVRAIATIVFKDLVPADILFDKKRGTLALAPGQLIKEDLWGTEVGGKYTMPNFFHHDDKASVNRRIIPCARLCNTIGNLYLQPRSLDEYRHSHAMGRFLVDHTLADLYKALTGGTPSRQMKQAVADAHGFFDVYKGDEGWQRLMEQWLTISLVDYYYNPEPIFDDITFTTTMPATIYYRALEHTLSLCREIIPKRSLLMTQRLAKNLRSTI